MQNCKGGSEGRRFDGRAPLEISRSIHRRIGARRYVTEDIYRGEKEGIRRVFGSEFLRATSKECDDQRPEGKSVGRSRDLLEISVSREIHFYGVAVTRK